MTQAPQRKPILMLTANDALLRSIQTLLEPVGFEVQGKQQPRDFLIALKKAVWELVLVDVAVGGERKGEVLTATKTIDPGVPLIALVPQDELPFCVDALQLGAADVLTVPLQAAELKFRVAGHYGKRTQAAPGQGGGLGGSGLGGITPTPRPAGSSVVSGSVVSGAAVSGAAVSSPVSVSAVSGSVLGGRGQDLGLLHDLSRFHEMCLRQFIALEKRALELQERLAEASGVSRLASANQGQALLLVHADPGLCALLQRLAAPYQVSVRQVFTGGEALDSASQSPVDIVVCDDELPDLRGEMVATSLKGELPYVDAVVVSGWGTEACVGRWVDSEADQEDDALTVALHDEEAWGLLLEAFVARRAQRAFGKRLAHTFKEQHRDFMRRYAEIRARLRAALGRAQAQGSGSGSPSPTGSSTR